MASVPTLGNIVPYASLEDAKKKLRGKKIVLVGGCFDILHVGHITFLKNARESADALVVALESDEFIVKNKHKKPVHTQSERAHVLASLRFVDVVVTLPLFVKKDEYQDLVAKLAPAVIAITEGDPKKNTKFEHARSVGASLKVVTPLLSKFSSSAVKERL